MVVSHCLIKLLSFCKYKREELCCLILIALLHSYDLMNLIDKLAHSTPMAGYLNVNKTYSQIQNHFPSLSFSAKSQCLAMYYMPVGSLLGTYLHF